jgi:hypothetical protein
MERHDGFRGVVLALTDGWATLLTPDGAFRRVRARPAWQVGDDVLVAAEVAPLRHAAPWLGSAVAAVAAAAVTFAVMTSLAANRVVLDVKVFGDHPATLAVNASGQVLTVTSEGKTALPVRLTKGEPLGAAIEALAPAEAATPGGASLAAVFVSVYAPKGAHPSSTTLRDADMALEEAGVTAMSALTTNMTTTAGADK